MPALRPQTGFSLLEVLVAFSVLALSLGVLMQVYSTGMRGVTLSEEYTKAIMLAESKLASVGSEIALEEGEARGEEDETYRWRVSLVPFTSEDLPENLGDVEPLQVDVEVAWSTGGHERRVALHSLRVRGPAEQRQ